LKKSSNQKLNTIETKIDTKSIKLRIIAAGQKAVNDAFEILNRIQQEKEAMDLADKGILRTDTKQGFAERNSK